MSILDYIEKMKDMYEGPRITAQEPRIELAGGGWLWRLLYKGKPGLQEGSIARKLKEEYIKKGMDKWEALRKSGIDASDIVKQKKLKIVKDQMAKTNYSDDTFVDLIDEYYKLTDYEMYKDIKRWDQTRPALADKSRAIVFPEWAEARYGDDYHTVLEKGQTREIQQSIDPNIKEPLSPADQMASNIDEMNKANIDELLEGKKKHAIGGRVGYNDGLLVGTPTDQVTQFDRRIYETPEGERVSEKSATLFLNGKWINVPSIHGGRSFTEDQLRSMLKEGVIEPTSIHQSRSEAETAAMQRSEMMKHRTKGFADGQLVTPSVDGSRPGYQGPEKYITPARRSGAEGFQGQKFYDVKDPTYSDGRRRVKTKEYKAWLEKEIAKAKKQPGYASKGFIRREPGLLRIAEAMQQADITDNFEHLMVNSKDQKKFEKYHKRKMKTYKKGMLQAGDMVYINNLEKNFDDVIFIADQLGESTDWVLDKLDERNEFRDFAKTEKDIMKKDSKYTKPRNDYLKVENWVQKNAKKYSNPETFEKALIKRFGNKNQFVMDMEKGGQISSVHFSDDFKKTMLNSDPGSPVKSHHLKQLIKSSLYNFNPKIKNAVTEEIKGIFNSENLPKLRTEARKMLNNNKLLSKFGLNKAITGPYAKVIQAEIGQQMWDDITNFRKPRVGTQEMLKAFEQIVADEFKPIFKEASKAINYSKNNEWKKAKDTLGIADNIAWDHKVPSSVIDKGYADIIEYTKVNPTSANFNERIKNAQFDRKINKLITKYEGVNTLDQKVAIVEEMNKVKSNFNKNFGNYLGEVEIKLDEKGNLRFSSSAEPLTTKMDRVKMLQTSLQQEQFPKMSNEDQMKFLKKMGYRCRKSGGAGEDVACYLDDVKKTRADLNSSDVTVRAKARTKQRKALQVASKLPQIGKIVRQGLQAGAAGLSTAFKWTGLGAPIGYAIEGIVEGGIYDYYRKQGYNHDQALAETFTPGLIAGRPEDVAWYGGAEKLREKELIGDVQQNPKVAQYVDALEEQNRIYEAFDRKEQGLQASRKDIIDAASADIQDLARSGAYGRVDRTLNPESMASQAYNTAVERQQALDERRKKDYMDKYYNVKEPSSFMQEKKQRDRYEEMNELFPDYSDEKIDDILAFYGEEKPDNLTYDQISDIFKDEDKTRYFADNFRFEKAQGGRAGYMGGGIAGIRRPHAIPPERQGLRSIMINANDD